MKTKQSKHFETVTGALFLTEGKLLFLTEDKLLFFFLTGKSSLGKWHLGGDLSEVQEMSPGISQGECSKQEDQRTPGFEHTWTLEQWQARLECGCGREPEGSGSQRVCAGTARHRKDQSMSGEGVHREEPVFSSSAPSPEPCLAPVSSSNLENHSVS